MKQTFKFADLFAGIGGMRIAFERAGGECVLTSEIDEYALKTYFANFPQDEGHVLVKDVLKLSAKDFQLNQGELDVLVAGFPCQPYSIAGLRKGLEDDRGGEIFTALLRLLETVQPKAFLLENVKGIKSHENGQTFQYMLDELSSSGYTIRYQTLNSMEHANVPQNRERVFIIGFRDPVRAENFKFPEKIDLSKTISL
jgi:DNA (cytosine-5)-methyltransferase 1